MTTKNILVTGGAGYIGSHTCIELLQADYNVIVYDNLSNSKLESLHRVEQITSKSISFIEGDIRDKDALKKAMIGCDAVIHFAGLKSVGESVEKPLMYYDNNVLGSLYLFQVMQELSIKNIIFSSSATVYGDPNFLPLTEDHRCDTTNPYGETKLAIETMLRALYSADKDWQIALLRYFNPVGAHESGLIGEDPSEIPNNLMPFITQVAVGKRKQLSVFGNDYQTHDGTGVRDYIHVVDLAKGHLKAVEALGRFKCDAINLGTGKGYSVLELVLAFEKASGQSIPYTVQDRRPGDIAACYADPNKAKHLLGWKAELSLNKMCDDSWRWQKQNPDGY